jgi:hypothetical protein
VGSRFRPLVLQCILRGLGTSLPAQFVPRSAPCAWPLRCSSACCPAPALAGCIHRMSPAVGFHHGSNFDGVTDHLPAANGGACTRVSGLLPQSPVRVSFRSSPLSNSYSQHLESLLHCGLGLARGLNFHLAAADINPSIFGGPIRTELVRRTWWCLQLADWCVFAMRRLLTHSLSPTAQHPFHLAYPCE